MISSEANRIGATQVRDMFGRIAKHYDFLNHFLSANRDKAWRRRAVEVSRVSSGDHVLDICTGTGDLAREYSRVTQEIVGMDFCAPMLEKASLKGLNRLTVADSLHLPVREGHFDVVSVAFGIRNVVDLKAGLEEMFRVLKPGGRAIILELTSPPKGLFAVIYNFYFQTILPRLASLFSEKSAYSYLPKSVSAFPDAPKLSEHLKEAGFSEASYEYLTLGIVGLHVGVKP